jgi:ferric-dicitrate binding protein FerR (iron transport regulator)
MDKTRIAQLIDLYYNKQLTEREFDELREAVLHGDSDDLQELLSEHMQAELHTESRSRFRTLTVRWSAAAAILLLAVPLYLILNKTKKGVHPPTAGIAKAKDVLPGKSGAILTLSDGSKLVLDSMRNGVIATQANASVALADGKLVYSKANNSPGAPLYNTVSTPRGRQFQMVLPDGSKLWLNAASSITYPVAFTGNQRLVKITGEAYFEIAADPSMPFSVQLPNGEKVEVLGTRFNINAYNDESTIRTTLVDGKVRVSIGKSAKVLEPGEQAYTENDGPQAVKVLHDADVPAAIAWKNNYFSFTDADLATVMRQLSRWYNVDVTFAGAVPSGEFNGKIGRALTLDQVLKVLTATRVKYKIENDKILILSE